jgi:radical SAM superfamily enzyme YgiQ (UPF0313 family)
MVDRVHTYRRQRPDLGEGAMSMDKKKSVVFIEPAGNASNVFDNYMRLPLTGTLYLGTLLHNAGYEVRIFNEAIMADTLDPFAISADIYCITALTVSSTRAISLAGQIRRIHPQSRIIMGGIHASLLPDDFLEVADTVVQGEAEGNIVDIVDGKYTEKIVQGEPIDDIEDLPLINYGLLENVASMNIIPIMTSRGCPFDCNFCTVTKIFGKRFRMQSPQRILSEIKHALGFFKTRSIFFYDDNFTANRPRVNELCDLLIAENLDITWSAQVRSDIAREPELLKKMAKTGCRIFFIGFESINDAALKAMHKSQTRNDIEKAIHIIHQSKINIHGMFIFGDDNDTIASLRETVDFAIQHHIDTVQFMILTPFPGTQVHTKIAEEGRLFHRRWEFYNGMYIVYQPKTMSAIQLQKETLVLFPAAHLVRRAQTYVLRSDRCAGVEFQARFSLQFRRTVPAGRRQVHYQQIRR